MTKQKDFSIYRKWCLDQWKEFIAALHFLSTLPLPGTSRLFQSEEPHFISGCGYFPVVGFLLGLCLSTLPLLFGTYLPPLVLAAFVVIMQILLTGGLHLDGLMDACDGLFGGTSKERKLEIMRDSRVGSFGVLGGGCVLLLKFALFASLPAHLLPIVFLVTLPTARWIMVLVARLFPPARHQGMGASFRQTVTLQRLLLSGSIALGMALSIGHLPGLLVWIAAIVAALLLGTWMVREVGGLTGDLYGAISEVTEVGSSLLFFLIHSWL